MGADAGFLAILGCFADDGMVEVANKGPVPVGELQVGDMVQSAEGFSRVYYTHSHKEESQTLRITAGQRTMELTTVHVVPVYTEECGAHYCPAAKTIQARAVKVGDVMYTSEGAATVSAVEKRASKVTYVLTEAETVVVDGIVATVFSTGAGMLETLPFRAIDAVARGALQWGPIGASLRTVLESPLLHDVESLVNDLPRAKLPLNTMRAAALPQASF